MIACVSYIYRTTRSSKSQRDDRTKRKGTDKPHAVGGKYTFQKCRHRLIERIAHERVVAPNVHKRVLFFLFCNGASDQHVNRPIFKKEKKRDTHLCQLRSYTAHNVDVHHVWLRPERSQARPLQGFPPLGKLVKALVTLARVNLNLKLADGQGLQGVLGDERRECVKFAAFDVNFEDVDERVT